MIAWIECAGRQRYIAAIVDSLEEAARIQVAMPRDIAEHSQLESRKDLERPCFLIERWDGFSFCSAVEAQERIGGYIRSGLLDSDDCRLIVYHLTKPFTPIVAGRDEMGRIPHTHLGAAEAALIAQRGIASLWDS